MQILIYYLHLKPSHHLCERTNGSDKDSVVIDGQTRLSCALVLNAFPRSRCRLGGHTLLLGQKPVSHNLYQVQKDPITSSLLLHLVAINHSHNIIASALI